MSENNYETILVETPAEGVGLIRLNRPKTLNALDGQIAAKRSARWKHSTKTRRSTVSY
jgi:enoyl-CoA hydratase/carnithine racemase